ncbi:MAG: FAS1-like dehydratase domain-containing protein [Rubrivivax sp.]
MSEARPWQAWVGRETWQEDLIGPTPLRALAAMLDAPESLPGVASDAFAPGTPLPPLWHWLYFLPLHRQDELGEDGHARRGGFLPPVPLPRRMWAGGRLRFDAPLHAGERVRRRSVIEDVRTRHGRSGELVFVTVRHELYPGQASAPAWTEWHDIVYREAPRPGEAASAPQPAPAPATARWSRLWQPDDVLLFRYSALTFNGHRIHYDRRYVTQVEGYPGLVVHGPLVATLLLELVRREQPQARVQAFSFKALRPAFDGRPLAVAAAEEPEPGHWRLWAADDSGACTMEAQARLA